MRSFAILLGVIGSAVCQWAPHQVGDTPEVAAAKSAHFAALSKAQDRSWSGPEDDGEYRPELYEADDRSGGWQSHDDGSYRPEHHDGPWDNNQHSQHHWAPQQQQWTHPAHHEAPQHWDAPQKKWTGPFAHSPGFDKNGAPLQVLDTPEVAAEKSRHFHLYAHGAYAGALAHHQ